MTEPDAIRCCLRAFSDAQATQFYTLWVHLTQRPSRSIPRTDFRIFRSDVGRDAVYLVLVVEVTRNDGLEVAWSVRLNASVEQLEISGGVEITDDEGTREVFSRSERAIDAAQAAHLITRLAAEVCAQVGYMEVSAQ